MTSIRLATIMTVFSAALAGVFVVSSPLTVQGYHDEIAIGPPAPTEDDFVRIGVELVWGYSDCGYTAWTEVASYSVTGQTIHIELVSQSSAASPGGGQCNASWYEYWYTSLVDIGPLAAGDYTVEMLEPYYGQSVIASFTVAPGLSPDADGDGVLAGTDYCRDTASSAAVDANGCSDVQVDGDGDGVCDPDAVSEGPSACTGSDGCPATPNPGQEDSDGDYHDDACDNCPMTPNYPQLDWDEDGAGNACDPELWGDVDCSGDVSAVDALKILRSAAGFSVSQQLPCPGIGERAGLTWGDMDCDSSVDAVDALRVLRHVAGLPNTPTVCPAIGTPVNAQA